MPTLARFPTRLGRSGENACERWPPRQRRLHSGVGSLSVALPNPRDMLHGCRLKDGNLCRRQENRQIRQPAERARHHVGDAVLGQRPRLTARRRIAARQAEGRAPPIRIVRCRCCDGLRCRRQNQPRQEGQHTHGDKERPPFGGAHGATSCGWERAHSIHRCKATSTRMRWTTQHDAAVVKVRRETGSISGLCLYRVTRYDSLLSTFYRYNQARGG